jgi:hypothetical protein
VPKCQAADRPQSKDRYGSANFAATGRGVQAVGNSQAAHQFGVGGPVNLATEAKKWTQAVNFSDTKPD